MENNDGVIPKGFSNDKESALNDARRDIYFVIKTIFKKFPTAGQWCISIDAVRTKARTKSNRFNNSDEITHANYLLDAIRKYRMLKGRNLTNDELNVFFTQYIDGIEVMDDGNLKWVGSLNHEGKFSPEERKVLEKMCQDILNDYISQKMYDRGLAEGLLINVEQTLDDAEKHSNFIECFNSFCSRLGIDCQEGFRTYCVKPQEYGRKLKVTEPEANQL